MTNNKLLFTALGKAASFTIKGATITLGSTIFSCYMACQIEYNANRLIYKYAPYKFVNVESANGITQDELHEIKRIYGKIDYSNTNNTIEEVSTMDQQQTVTDKPLLSLSSIERQKQTQIEQELTSKFSNKTRFWQEKDDEREAATLSPLSSILPVSVLSNQDILACSMTG